MEKTLRVQNYQHKSAVISIYQRCQQCSKPKTLIYLPAIAF